MQAFSYGQFDAIGERLRQDWQELIDSPLPDRLRHLLALLDASDHDTPALNDRVLWELLAIDEPSPQTAILLKDFRHALERAANGRHKARRNEQ
jgi:hypothetical protein